MGIKKSLKTLALILYKTLFNSVYKINTLFKQTNNKKAVFVVSRTGELDGNLLYIYEELIKQQPSIEIHFVHTTNKMNLKLFKEISIISNARYLIIDDYYLPVYLIKPSKSLRVIQLWHAAGAFKKFGYSTMNTKFGPSSSYLNIIPIHSNYSYVYVSSTHIIPYYAEAFNMSIDRIFPVGPPRIDFFNNQEEIRNKKEQIKIEFPIVNSNNKTFILVAPTYRASGNASESDVDFIDMLVQYVDQLRSDIQIIFKGHPYLKDNELSKLHTVKNITVATKYSINEWMLIADALVTDYSSLVFDFSLLKKPFAHYVPDLDKYIINRGLYEDIEVISDGIIIKRMNELIHWMNDRRKGEYYDTSRMIEYNFDNTIDVSRKIVSHFTEN